MASIVDSCCDNDARYPEKIVKRGHAEEEMHWHYILEDPTMRTQWSERNFKGLENFVATDKAVFSNYVIGQTSNKIGTVMAVFSILNERQHGCDHQYTIALYNNKYLFTTPFR